MQNYIFYTDSSVDLPAEILNTEGAQYYGFTYSLDGSTQIHHHIEDTVATKAFYSAMSEGRMPQTSQINAQEFIEAWEPYLQNGQDILYYGMSSAISNTFTNSLMAAKELQEKYPQRRIEAIDSLSATGIQGIVYYLGLIKYKNGATFDELKKWLEETRLNAIGIYTTDDLNHLKRGGRISAASASFGTLLDIKPLITMNKKGEVINFEKIKSRKKAFKRMIDILDDKRLKDLGYMSETALICHGDCYNDALVLKDMVQKKNKDIKDILISDIGPIIGTHLGPNCIGINFIGKERSE